MRRNVQNALRKSRQIALRVTGTGTAVIDEGGTQATLTDNNTGDYTLTFVEPFIRVPTVTVSMVTASTRAEVPAAQLAAGSIKILTFGYNNTTPTDAVFHVLVTGFDAAL